MKKLVGYQTQILAKYGEEKCPIVYDRTTYGANKK